MIDIWNHFFDYSNQKYSFFKRLYNAVVGEIYFKWNTRQDILEEMKRRGIVEEYCQKVSDKYATYF